MESRVLHGTLAMNARAHPGPSSFRCTLEDHPMDRNWFMQGAPVRERSVGGFISPIKPMVYGRYKEIITIVFMGFINPLTKLGGTIL